MKPAREAKPPGIKTMAVRLELDLNTHRLLRVVAARHGKSMASYARELVERDLAGRGAGE